MYATSHGDDSFDDKTASASEQVARVLQSPFNHREEDTGPAGDISIETQSRRRRSVEIANSSSKSHTVSSRASSRRRLVRGRGASEGDMRDDDI